VTWTVFRTISKCYLYDRNINSVVEIPESDYIELNSAHISENLLEKYRRNRMLENTQLQEIRHGFTDLIEDYLEERMEQLVLQVTQQCNLRCEYCTYTDNEKYNNRTHANKFMSFYTARACLKNQGSCAKSTKWRWMPSKQRREKKRPTCHIWWQFCETI